MHMEGNHPHFSSYGFANISHITENPRNIKGDSRELSYKHNFTRLQ